MKILTGPFQSGKSSYVLKKAVQHVRDKESFLIITPSRLLRTQTSALLLKQAGAITGQPVITLGELQNTLMERCFPDPSLRPKAVSNFEQFLLLSALCTRLEPQFKVFTHISERPSLIKSLYRLVGALREENAALIPAEGALKARAEDLQLLLAAYCALLAEQGLCDTPRSIELLAEALPDAVGEFPRYIYIDGFTDFTASQHVLISAYLRRAESAGSESLITLTHSVSPIARDTLKTFQKSFPDAEIIPLDGRPSLGEAFLKSQRPQQAPRILEIQAFGRHKECEETANQIKKLMITEGTGAEDILIVSPNHELYSPLLRSVFRKAEIPLRFTRDDLLSYNPLVVFLKRCLQFMGQNISHEELSYFSKSNYLKGSLRTALASAPILIPQAFQGSISFWKEALARNAEASEASPDTFARLKEALDLLGRTLHMPIGRSQHPLDTYIGILISFLEACGISEALNSGISEETARDYTALQKLKAVFTDLKKSLRLIGEDSLTLQTFLFYFNNIIGETRYRSDIPAQGAVRVVSLDEARGISVRAVFFLGANEGGFPPSPVRDLFDNSDRILLNHAAQKILGRNVWETDALHFHRSKFLFASALSLAESWVFVCRTPADERGGYFPPAHALIKLFSLTSFTRIPEYPSENPRDNNPEIYAPAPKPENIFVSRFLPLPPENKALSEILHYKEGLHKAADALETGVLPDEGLYKYVGGIGENSYAARKYQGSILPVSPTTLESFGRCPYRGLWLQVWKLRPLALPQYSPEAVDTGTLYHHILEEYIRETGGEGFNKGLLKELIAKHAETFPQKAALLLDFNRLYAVLSVFLKSLQTNLSELQSPSFLELSTKDNGLPNQIIPLNETISLKINARIDRIDVSKSGEGFHIIDYKTKGSSYKDYPQTAHSLFQGSLYTLLAEANGIRPIASILYLFLEKCDMFSEYSLPEENDKKKTGGFHSISELTAYKKIELLSLIALLQKGLFMPYTVLAHLSPELQQASQGVFGKKAKLESPGKCTYCDYQSLCPRIKKLIPH